MLWLFVRDRKFRPMSSGALWVPLLWLAIIGSRPVSVWLGASLPIETAGDYAEGSPLDAAVYFLLMLAGLAVLWIRRVNWGGIFTSNYCLVAFFFYCGISVFWSDYSFISLKRWIKDIGNVVMVLIMLTEKDPVQGVRAVSPDILPLPSLSL